MKISVERDSVVYVLPLNDERGGRIGWIGGNVWRDSRWFCKCDSAVWRGVTHGGFAIATLCHE